jgi:competence protein ComEA
MPARLAAITHHLALAACFALALAGGWGRLRPIPAEHEVVRGDVSVHVAGRVAAPGRYTLPWGSRVEDAIAAAGGLAPDAEASLIAWAAPLTDGATILAPSRLDPAGDARIDVNAASERLLATLPGVGPVMAARIVALRPYHTLEDLLRVPGIGPARLAALRDAVALGDGP